VAIKESAEGWVKGKPAQAIVVIGLVGLLIGGVIGLGAGYQIEKNRTKSDVAKLKKNGVTTGGSGGSGGVALPGKLGQSVGKVTAVGTDSITVDTKRKGSQKFQTTATTQFEKAVAGKTSDIVVGRRVLVTITGRAVIILPEGSRIGRLVTNVGSDSFSIAKPNGGPGAKLMLANVKSVDTLSPAKFSDIKTGSLVLAGGREASKDAFNAVELIILEAGSTFAN
jgi:hypothetical protein